MTTPTTLAREDAPPDFLSPQEIIQLAAGRELDKLIGIAFGFVATEKWHLLAPEGGSYIYFDFKHQADQWLAEVKQEYPASQHAAASVVLVRYWPRASSNIADAWLVVEELNRRGLLVDLTRRKDHDRGTFPYECLIWNLSGEPDTTAVADEAPLAICRAALLAFLPDRPAPSLPIQVVPAA